MRRSDNSRNDLEEEAWEDLIVPSGKNKDPFPKREETDPLAAFLGTDFFEKTLPPPQKQKRNQRNPWLAMAVVFVIALVTTAGIFCTNLLPTRTKTESEIPTVVTTPFSIQQTMALATQPVATQPEEPQPDIVPISTGELRYFGKKLNDPEQLAYFQLVAGISQYQATVKLYSTTEELELEAVVDAVWRDYPEYFWITGAWSASNFSDSKGFGYTFTLDYSYSAEEAREHSAFVETTIQPVLNALQDKTDYEKVKGVYEYLIEHTAYDYDYHGMSLYELLHDGKAVCEGYARATQLLLNRLDVEALLVTGEAGDNRECHAWNIVKIDGEYYQLDTTWGDPLGEEQTMTYYYLNLTDNECFEDHWPDDPSQYPSCNATRYNYFRYEGYYLEWFDQGKLAEWVQQDGDQWNKIRFRCADESLYRQVRTWLFDDGRIWELCPDMREYYYSYNDGLLALEITKTRGA